MDDCEHDQLMNEVTCAGASRDSRWQCIDCDDGHGNGIWFVFAPEDAVVLPADVVNDLIDKMLASCTGQASYDLAVTRCARWTAAALLPKP